MDAAAMHRAFESLWRGLYDQFDGARYECRSDLSVFVFTELPIPQANGAWVGEDSHAAADGLRDAVAEVEAAGAHPWVQTRSQHERTRQAAVDLGLTDAERVPGMLVRADELVSPACDLEIEGVSEADFDQVIAVLVDAFGHPREIFEFLHRLIWPLPGIAWYLGRADGAIVSTALGALTDDAVGIFNVATPPQHRGRGYGAALTARAAREGFDAGAEFAYLQSSELGHGVYRRLGFRDVEEYVLLTRPAA
jgi:GNAT superfamily N-acetyltransferase